MNAPAANLPELQRMVTVASCGWKPANIMLRLTKEAAVVNKDTGEIIKEAVYHEQVPLVRITGIVTKTKPGSKAFGDRISEWLTLSGEFVAVNLVSKKVFSASKAIVSDVVSGPIQSALEAGAGSAEFAVEIGAKYSPKSATNYEFYTTPLMEVKQTNRMEQLLALAGVFTTPALAAPEAGNAGGDETGSDDPQPAADAKPVGKGKGK